MYAIELYATEVGPNWDAILNKMKALEASRKWDLSKLIKPKQVKTHIDAMKKKFLIRKEQYTATPFKLTKDQKQLPEVERENLKHAHAAVESNARKEWDQVRCWLLQGKEREERLMSTEHPMTEAEIAEYNKKTGQERKKVRENRFQKKVALAEDEKQHRLFMRWASTKMLAQLLEQPFENLDAEFMSWAKLVSPSITIPDVETDEEGVADDADADDADAEVNNLGDALEDPHFPQNDDVDRQLAREIAALGEALPAGNNEKEKPTRAQEKSRDKGKEKTTEVSPEDERQAEEEARKKREAEEKRQRKELERAALAAARAEIAARRDASLRLEEEAAIESGEQGSSRGPSRTAEEQEQQTAGNGKGRGRGRGTQRGRGRGKHVL